MLIDFINLKNYYKAHQIFIINKIFQSTKFIRYNFNFSENLFNIHLYFQYKKHLLSKEVPFIKYIFIQT